MEIIFALLGLAVPVGILYLIFRGFSTVVHHGSQQPQHLTAEQLKRVATGVVIAGLVPGFLYQLMSTLTNMSGASSASSSYMATNPYGDPYATTGVLIGGGVALLVGLALKNNKVASYGLAAGGVYTLLVEFLSHFNDIAAPLRVAAIGVLLIALIAYAVKKTLDHERAHATEEK